MKIPTGIKGLDNLVEGGFDKGSLIVVSGGPGSGKTILSSIILSSSAEFMKETVLYVSFGENKENIINTVKELAARRIPRSELDRRSQEIESSGRTHILDMSVLASENAEKIVLESILEEVLKRRPAKLVIDPFTTLYRQQPGNSGMPNELRSVLHNFFGKILHELECTTILVLESTEGSRAIAEEFASDGIITLERIANEGRTLRTISISKMRKTAIQRNMALFSLYNGFKIFTPFSVVLPRKIKNFSAIPDSSSFYSSGSQDLDTLLGGGFRKGTSILIESSETVPEDALANVMNTVILNALCNRNIVVGLPYAAMSSNAIRAMLEPFCNHRIIEENLRIFDYSGSQRDHVPVRMTSDVIKDRNIWFSTLQNLGRKGKPVLKFYGVDNLECRYSPKSVIPMLASDISTTAGSLGLTLLLAKPNLELSKTYANMATTHLRLDSRFGTTILQGVKPWTPNYELELSFYQGYPQIELEPII